MTTPDLTTYVVTVKTPSGKFLTEIRSHLGTHAVKRRAQAVMFMHQRTGTPDDYVVLDCVEGTLAEPRR